MNSKLCLGYTRHIRMHPFRHEFRYPLLQLLIDLDELPKLKKLWPYLGINHFGWYGFYEKDHGNFGKTPLKAWAQQVCQTHLNLSISRVSVVCFPRWLGYVFSPLSLFFCYDTAGRWRAVIYEVRNTLQQQHCYVHALDGTDSVHCHSSDKRFYVSPFLPIAGVYHFRLYHDADKLALAIRQHRDGKDVHFASQHGRFVPLTRRALAASLISHFASSIKVIARISWHALLLRLKGERYRKAPPPSQPTIST